MTAVCDHHFGGVVNSRKREDWIYRRRYCSKCKQNFSTTEIVLGGTESMIEVAGNIGKLSPMNQLLVKQIIQALAENQ